jgi:CDP-paratose 2-epimerase
MRILITGGAGFVGSSLAMSFKKKYPAYQVYALDNLKRKGSHLNLDRLQIAGVEFIHGDIRNKEDFDGLPSVDMVIDACAEPSVLAGINSDPDYLLNTNLVGTIHCLNYAKKHRAGFIFLSTSRIYPIALLESASYTEEATRFSFSDGQNMPGISSKGINEDCPTEGYRSLYGATKLASELLIAEYQQFYQMKTVINRCGVLTGPWQMGKVDQGVVVLWVARHFWKKKLGYFGYGGEGKQVRDILHIDDLFELVDYQIHHIDSVNGGVYNAGGGSGISVSLQELTAICEEVSGNTIEIEKVKENRTADLRIYITDNTKITAATGWEPKVSVKEIISDIYQWIAANEEVLKPIVG